MRNKGNKCRSGMQSAVSILDCLNNPKIFPLNMQQVATQIVMICCVVLWMPLSKSTKFLWFYSQYLNFTLIVENKSFQRRFLSLRVRASDFDWSGDFTNSTCFFSTWLKCDCASTLKGSLLIDKMATIIKQEIRLIQSRVRLLRPILATRSTYFYR